MFKKEIRIVFYTNKFLEMKNFYSHVLKLNMFKEFQHDDAPSGVVYEMGSIYIELLELKTHNGYKSDSYLYVEVNNVEQFYNEIKLQYVVVEELEIFPWGHTSFSILDPDGNKLKFFSQIV